MPLLSLAKKFLMLHAKLSIHILQGILLPIYSILNGIFAICSHFIRIYVHTLERQLHAIYIYSHIFTFIQRAISCCTSIGKAIFVLLIHIFERQSHVICSYLEKHFRATFNIYTHLQSTWLPILYTHVHGEQHFHTI